MIALKAHFDGKVFVPDEPVDLTQGQAVRVTVVTVESPTPTVHPDSISEPRKVDFSKLIGLGLKGPNNLNPQFPDDDSLWEGTTGNYLENGPNKPSTKKPTDNKSDNKSDDIAE